MLVMSEVVARELDAVLAPVFAQWRWWVVIRQLWVTEAVPASKTGVEKAGTVSQRYRCV